MCWKAKPLEKQLESHATGSLPGSIHGALQAPYSTPRRRPLASTWRWKFRGHFSVQQGQGKISRQLERAGYRLPRRCTVGARFSDTVNLDLEKDEWKEFTKSP